MPAIAQILSGLKEIANSWKPLSMFWHVYFSAGVLALALGFRPMKRWAGLLLAPPLLSVSAMAWTVANPFNGAAFAVLGVLVLYFSARLPKEPARIAPPWFLLPGLALFVFGWTYPHFLETQSFLPYLYAAPTGLIPCPTLSIVIGLALVLDGLGSRTLCIVLGIAGLFYGIVGVVRLGVTIDWELLLGALIILARAFARKPKAQTIRSVQ
jgi:hypothetical protein